MPGAYQQLAVLRLVPCKLPLSLAEGCPLPPRVCREPGTDPGPLLPPPPTPLQLVDESLFKGETDFVARYFAALFLQGAAAGVPAPVPPAVSPPPLL